MTKGGAPRDWPTTYFRYIAEIMRCIVPFFCSTFAYYLIYFNLPDGAKLVSAKAMDNVATHAKQSLARICVDLKGNPNNYIPQNPRKDLVKHKLTGSEHQPPITEEQLQIVKDRYQRIRPVQGDETSPVNEYQTEDDFGSQFMLDQYRVPLAKIGFQFCLMLEKTVGMTPAESRQYLLDLMDIIGVNKELYVLDIRQERLALLIAACEFYIPRGPNMNRFRSWLPLIFTIPTAMDSYLTPGFNYRSTKLLYQQGGRPDEILEETLGAVMQSTGVTLDQVKVLFRTMSTINGGADFEDDGASTRFRRQLVRAVMLATGDLTLNYSEVMRLYKVLLDTRHGAGGNWWTENEKISLIRLLADWGYDNYSEIAQTLDRSDRGVQIFIQRSTLWWIAEDVARIEILEAHYQDFVSNTPNLSNFDHILRRFHRSPEFRRSVLKRIPSIQDAERAARYKARNRAKRAAAKASA